MKYLFIVILFIVGCTSDKKEAHHDSARFSMDCKKLAQKLKVDFIIEGSNERPVCFIGQKDSDGSFSGANFSTREEIDGALRALWLQRVIPLHNKLQACNKKCAPMRGTMDEYIKCWRPCGQAAGYFEEDEI